MSLQVSGQFQYFFKCYIRQETNFSHLIKLLLKKIWKNQVLKLIFLWELEQNILNKYNCSDTLQMSKIQSRLEVKTKIIESMFLINQIICEMYLILESYII